jgi:hypothetical protein
MTSQVMAARANRREHQQRRAKKPMGAKHDRESFRRKRPTRLRAPQNPSADGRPMWSIGRTARTIEKIATIGRACR